jgi:hypothetical protein
MGTKPNAWITPKGTSVRLSYAYLLSPDEEGKYRTMILIPKSDKTTMKALKACVEVAKEMGITSKWGGKLPSKLRLPLKDGDVLTEEREEEGKSAEGFAGHYYFNCSTKTKPGVVDKNGKDITDPAEIYSGCWVRCSVAFLPYNFVEKGQKGITVVLNNIMKVEDDDHLGGGRSSASADFGTSGFDDDEGDDDYTPPKKPTKKKPVIEDDEDDYEPPKKKKRPIVEEDDEDDYEPPKKKKRPIVEDDEDDYEPPRKPTKRKRPVDDDDEDF